MSEEGKLLRLRFRNSSDVQDQLPSCGHDDCPKTITSRPKKPAKTDNKRKKRQMKIKVSKFRKTNEGDRSPVSPIQGDGTGLPYPTPENLWDEWLPAMQEFWTKKREERKAKGDGR